jgi:2-iminobutanoate/2-iminopropanoate deaminase
MANAKQVVNVDAPVGPLIYPFSTAVIAGDFIFVSGHGSQPPGGADPVEGGIEAEVRQALENVKRALEAAGATLDDVVKVSAFLRDVDRDVTGYNRVYQTYFPERPPARTTVGGKIFGSTLVEIDCVAWKPRREPSDA